MPQTPSRSLQHSPHPLSGLKGSISKGRRGKGGSGVVPSTCFRGSMPITLTNGSIAYMKQLEWSCHSAVTCCSRQNEQSFIRVRVNVAIIFFVWAPSICTTAPTFFWPAKKWFNVLWCRMHHWPTYLDNLPALDSYTPQHKPSLSQTNFADQKQHTATN